MTDTDEMPEEIESSPTPPKDYVLRYRAMPLENRLKYQAAMKEVRIALAQRNASMTPLQLVEAYDAAATLLIESLGG